MTTELHGITLAQFAMIRAGVADGLSLADVLDLAGADARQWTLAENAWDARMLQALEDAEVDLLEELATATTAARTLWERRIEPLDDDPRAWFDFFRAFTSAPSPAEMLSSHELSLGDVMSLQRRWSARLQSDDALRSRVMEILSEDPRPVVEIHVGPLRILKPAREEEDGESTSNVRALDHACLPFEVSGKEPGSRLPSLIVPLPEPVETGDQTTQLAKAITDDDLREGLTPFAPSAAVDDTEDTLPTGEVGPGAPSQWPPAVYATRALDARAFEPARTSPPTEARFETEVLDVRAFSSFQTQPALPFLEAPELDGPPPEPKPNPLETETLDVRDVLRLRGQRALPFHGTTRLPLELHAALCAEAGLFPDELGRLLVEVGLTLREKVEEDAAWKMALARDQALERRWYHAYEEAQAKALRDRKP